MAPACYTLLLFYAHNIYLPSYIARLVSLLGENDSQVFYCSKGTQHQ